MVGRATLLSQSPSLVIFLFISLSHQRREIKRRRDDGTDGLVFFSALVNYVVLCWTKGRVVRYVIFPSLPHCFLGKYCTKYYFNIVPLHIVKFHLHICIMYIIRPAA